MAVPTANDTRLLLVAVAAFVALVAYIGVAFADTTASVDLVSEVAPWLPHASKLTPIPRKGRRPFVVQVTPSKAGNYGALVPTVIPSPAAGRTYSVGLWLKGEAGRVGVEVDEFAPGASSVYIVNATVDVTPGWRHYTFDARVRGSWLGLGMYVYRIDPRRKTWFAIRGLTATIAAS